MCRAGIVLSAFPFRLRAPIRKATFGLGIYSSFLDCEEIPKNDGGIVALSPDGLLIKLL